MLDFRHVGFLLKLSTAMVLALLLNACSQSPVPVASKPKSVAVPFRSADAPAPFVHPVPKGRISSSFANYVVKSRNRKHHGVDFAAPIGTPVYAASSGVVLNADMGSMSDAFGLAVLIEHGDKFQSLSAHLSRIDVNIGDWVQAGQQIGLVGKTGRATGPHLHFELWQNTIPKDPLLFLPIKAPNRAIAAEPKFGTGDLLAKQLQATKQPQAPKLAASLQSKKPQGKPKTKRTTKTAKKITTKTVKHTTVQSKKTTTAKKTAASKKTTQTASSQSVTSSKRKADAPKAKANPTSGKAIAPAKTSQAGTGQP